MKVSESSGVFHRICTGFCTGYPLLFHRVFNAFSTLFPQADGGLSLLVCGIYIFYCFWAFENGLEMGRIKGQSDHFSCQIGLIGDLQDFSTVLGCGNLSVVFGRPVNNMWKSRKKGASMLSRAKMNSAEILCNRLKRRIHISFTPMKKDLRETISLNRCLRRPFERAFYIHYL